MKVVDTDWQKHRLNPDFFVIFVFFAVKKAFCCGVTNFFQGSLTNEQ